MKNNVAESDNDALQTLWNDDAELDRLAQQAVQEALQEHKRNGQSIVIWRDGRVITLPPQDIPTVPAATQ